MERRPGVGAHGDGNVQSPRPQTPSLAFRQSARQSSARLQRSFPGYGAAPRASIELNGGNTPANASLCFLCFLCFNLEPESKMGTGTHPAEPVPIFDSGS